MYCKWCGMDSKNEERCEWCDKLLVEEEEEQEKPPTPLREPLRQQLEDMSPPSAKPLTDEPPVSSDEVGITPPEAPPQQPIRPSPGMAPTRGRIPFMPISMEEEEEEERLPPLSERLLKYSSIMLVILGIGLIIAHKYPEIWLVPLFAALFASGLLLSLCQLVYYFSDKFADYPILLIPVIVVGPFYGTLLFVLQGLVRRKTNISIITVMATYFIIRLAVGGAAHGLGDTITYMFTLDLSFSPAPKLMQLIPLLFLLGGWALANITRPLSEE